MGVYLRGESWYIDFYEDGKRYTERVGQVSKGVAEEKLSIRRSEVIRGEWKPKKVKISFDKFKEQYLETSLPILWRKDAIRDKPFHGRKIQARPEGRGSEASHYQPGARLPSPYI
jgi:hypothetical protein